jgi:hypothetical protein
MSRNITKTFSNVISAKSSRGTKLKGISSFSRGFPGDAMLTGLSPSVLSWNGAAIFLGLALGEDVDDVFEAEAFELLNESARRNCIDGTGTDIILI